MLYGRTTCSIKLFFENQFYGVATKGRDSARRSFGAAFLFYTKEDVMSIDELITLLIASLKDDLMASIKREDNLITILFPNGTDRIILVE